MLITVLLGLKGLRPPDEIKVLSGSLGPIDFVAGQVTLKAYLPNDREFRQVIL